MKRTNILLTDKQHKIIKRYSRKEGRTIFVLAEILKGLQKGYKELSEVKCGVSEGT